jgi:ATPase subunit of ABC transporter with duplicated ATPase domains
MRCSGLPTHVPQHVEAHLALLCSAQHVSTAVGLAEIQATWRQQRPPDRLQLTWLAACGLQVSVLSGGEKARLALAKFMLTRGSLLVNHLDHTSLNDQVVPGL